MKNILIILFFSIVSLGTQAQQCDVTPLTEKGILQIKDGYTFLKKYPVSGEQGKKYSYICSQGASYLINLANRDVKSKGFYIDLYDSDEKKLASSYNDGVFSPGIIFNCQKTGIYYLEFNFLKTKEYCAAAILSMKR